MIPGTILCHHNFKFSDGATAKKLIILLTDLTEEHSYILAKTTSQENRKSKKSGCQKNDIYPNFFIPKTHSTFPKDTWVDLNEFFEFEAKELLQKHFSGEIQTINVLERELTKKLLSCSIECEDISFHQQEAIKTALAAMGT